MGFNLVGRGNVRAVKTEKQKCYKQYKFCNMNLCRGYNNIDKSWQDMKAVKKTRLLMNRWPTGETNSSWE